MIVEPWPYIVVDDFLDEEDFIKLKAQVEEHNQYAIAEAESNGNTKGHYRHKYDYDPLEDYNIMGYFIQFDKKRPYTNLEPLTQLIKTCYGANYPIHEDAPHKIFSFLLYVSPEVNVGTQIYDANKNFVTEIEWKPNRAVMFCPIDNVTYHAYGSSTDRFTLMQNLVDKQ